MNRVPPTMPMADLQRTVRWNWPHEKLATQCRNSEDQRHNGLLFCQLSVFFKIGPRKSVLDRNLKTCPPVNVATTDTIFVARIPARAYRDEPSLVECLWCA